MNLFSFQQNIYVDYAFRFLLSLACGFCLGFERKTKRNPVGIRTLVLISLSSCLLSILSEFVAAKTTGTDAARISAGVVTGIGFLGGGAIFRHGMNIRGLTTAAIIWTASALGLASGAGLYMPVLITLVICILILVSMKFLENRLFPAQRTKTVSLEFDSEEFNESEIRRILLSHGLIVNDLDMEYLFKEGRVIFNYDIKTPDKFIATNLSRELSKLGHLMKFTIVE